jgi:hypothetical protein
MQGKHTTESKGAEMDEAFDREFELWVQTMLGHSHFKIVDLALDCDCDCDQCPSKAEQGMTSIGDVSFLRSMNIKP